MIKEVVSGMKFKSVCGALLLGVLTYMPVSQAVMIQGWGDVGDKLFQLGFDSNQGPLAATRTLYATLPDSAVQSMALSPDGMALYAISATSNTVYRIDLSTSAIRKTTSHPFHDGVISC